VAGGAGRIAGAHRMTDAALDGTGGSAPDPAGAERERPPIPFGVRADTGETPPLLTDADLDRIGAVPVPRAEPHLALVASIADPTDLTQTGWGIIFPRDANPAIRQKLTRLIEHRQQQVDNAALFRVFDGADGARPGESAENWLFRHGLSLGPVEPENGVPYYLILVGSPEEISFAFQSTLDLHFCIGRLYFDDINDYETYANHVVDYETAATLSQRRQAAVWLTRNQNDDATLMLSGILGAAFTAKPLGQGPRFKGMEYQTTSFLNDAATGENLLTLLRGSPALLFTGSHGLEWKASEPEVQRQNQGALVTSTWVKGTPVARDQFVSGDDVPADAKLTGTMCFMFACFGGACPLLDSYRLSPTGDPLPLAPKPFVASLPQRLLRAGALAVLAHSDRAWSYGFVSGGGVRQDQLIRGAVEGLMRGLPAGRCADQFQDQWGALSAQFSLRQDARRNGTQPVSTDALANLAIARDDARNYIVLGDPAARLRIKEMTA
jgi:hypothetical protein